MNPSLKSALHSELEILVEKRDALNVEIKQIEQALGLRISTSRLPKDPHIEHVIKSYINKKKKNLKPKEVTDLLIKSGFKYHGVTKLSVIIGSEFGDLEKQKVLKRIDRGVYNLV